MSWADKIWLINFLQLPINSVYTSVQKYNEDDLNKILGYGSWKYIGFQEIDNNTFIYYYKRES